MDQRNREYAKRFWDELGIRKKGDPPTNLPALLSDLGVIGKPFEVKKVAVVHWLEENEPIGLLPIQLKREGYV